MADRPRLKTPFDTPTPPERAAAAREAESAPAQPRRRFRFSTRTFFGLTFVLGFATAGFNAVSASGGKKVYYVFFSLAAPIVALVIAATVHQLLRRLNKPKPADDRGPFEDSPFEDGPRDDQAAADSSPDR